MLTTGFTIFLGVGLILAKLPRRTMLRVLKHDLLLDIAVSLIVLMIHFGTFSGVMAPPNRIALPFGMYVIVCPNLA